MGLISKVSDLFSGGNQVNYSYACRECEHEFEAEESHKRDVECPECGASNINDVVF